ncbi:MAG: helix-turn-helix domain-containing protein [Saprospiraceae bacterium]
MKKSSTEIKTYQLDAALYRMHKDEAVQSDFGLDNSKELIEGGFGLYSSANVKSSIGPIKTTYYRMALLRAGTANFDLGIETYHPVRDSIVFGFPGQVFSLYDQSDDFFVYYMLFKEDFMAESLLLKDNREQYPFFNYSGVQSFQLSQQVAEEVENLILKINGEIKNRKADIGRMIRLYLQLILVHANRSYEEQQLDQTETATSGNALFRRFVKLVSQHFLKLRKVSEYAKLLNISADHLNRTIKSQSEKTAGELIDSMILTEAKAYLLHTELSNAEIAYQLDFSDPSHFNKFFKKQTNCTPLQYRGKT